MTSVGMVARVTVFIVEDHEDFSRFVLSVLRQRKDIQVVGQAGDGLEAIQRIRHLRPDLILLDIGLPTLNGLEVAQRIRTLSPGSKILFTSQESSPEIVQEALLTGAQGYLLKPDAAGELLRAIDEIVNGNSFVSHRLASVVPGAIQNEQPRNPSSPRQDGAQTRVHRVSFFPNDAAFVDGFAEFIEAAMDRDTPVIVVATANHRADIVRRLQAGGRDVSAAQRDGTLFLLDARAMLSGIPANNWPDTGRFMKRMSDLIYDVTKAANREHLKVAACGEGAYLLWAKGKTGAAIQLEQLWDEIAKTVCVDILCGYVLSYFRREADVRFFERICSEHSDASCV